MTTIKNAIAWIMYLKYESRGNSRFPFIPVLTRKNRNPNDRKAVANGILYLASIFSFWKIFASFDWIKIKKTIIPTTSFPVSDNEKTSFFLNRAILSTIAITRRNAEYLFVTLE